MRLFLALPIPEDVSKDIASFVETIKTDDAYDKVKWVAPKNFHITLQFIGQMPEENVEPLCETLANRIKEIKPFELTCLSPMPFPRVDKPRGYALTVTNSVILDELVAIVRETCEELEVKVDVRRYIPHLTIGRVHYPFPVKSYPDVKMTVLVEKIILYSSEQDENQQLVYKPIEVLLLK